MEWSSYPIGDYPGELWSDWQDLAVRHHAANPMLDAEFVKCLVMHFGDVVRLRVLVGKYDNSVAILALVESIGLGRWWVFRPSQAQTALLVGSPTIRVDWNRVLTALPGVCLKLDVLSLDPREHPLLLGYSPLTQREDSARNICVDVDRTFSEYWEDRPRKLKQNIRRYRNRISEEFGQLKFVVASTPSDVAAATDRYGILESRGWKGKVGTALHPGNLQGKFYRSLMVTMAEHSRAFVFELYVDDILLATRLCLAGDAILVMLKTTYDESFRRYATGRLLLHDTLQYVFENDLAKVVDFYTNATDDQMDWATSFRSMSHASIYRSVTMRLIIRGLRSAKDLVKRVLPGHT